MNRRYTTEQFREIVKIIRETYSDANLTTDIIVGFQGNQKKNLKKHISFYQK